MQRFTRCFRGAIPEMAATRLSRLIMGGLIVLAFAYVAAILFLVVGAPQGIVGYRTAFETLRQLAWIGIAGTAVSVALALSTRGSGALRGAAAVAALTFAVPVGVMYANEATPPPGDFINDITTDLDDPPQFRAVVAIRPPGSNPIEYGGAAVAARQRQAYPEVAPIFTELAPAAAFQKAFETADSLGWEIVSGDMQAGTIEAVDTTRFFRFKDDVVIRIRATDAGSRVDLRSRSRVGRSDLGKNAKRILTFTDEFKK